ncbi:uncharacterized protein A1O9_02361 [Exophiala aquamarina CBS 119918]|uniref:SMP-30/Gluconolactonase/LRE-like region domain-containing protein n=1 Tax=Exophiala aquamarina CBS 119918 TaxID=1182545 RepID=A0A072PL61_9EURO|nr:uncharacterized protein A1O9_02361 [Exophiala aquamarina CBS 119918]KEF60799.1 hypothetical protein A1O9_02361 [Exophiala aquamarina CBS 119918]
MASKLSIVSLLVLLAPLSYQLFFRDLFFATLGWGRVILPVSAFPYKCHRITGDQNVQACEDMWLDEKSRTLFLACSDALSRKEWNPNVHRLNASGRGLNDHIVAMNIDNPATAGGFTYRVLKTPGFGGIAGDGTINVMGMTGTTSADGSDINLWLINNRPSVDAATGEVLDNAIVGANSTIDVFSTTPGAESMKHVKTFANPQIATPNNLAVQKDGGFFFTNDHGLHKLGLQHQLSPVLGTGDLSYCSAEGACRKLEGGFKFPNGLLLGSDGLVYVPGAVVGGITVFKPGAGGSVTKVHYIDLNYPIDNLSEDANGDLYAAAMPKVLAGVASLDDPVHGPIPPATVWRVRRLNREARDKYEYSLTKIIEDRDGEVLPFTTTVIHDASTGRLFMIGRI